MTQPANTPIPPPSADQIVCPNPACSAQNRAGTRFCASCGTSLAATSGGSAPGTPPYSALPPPPPRPGFASIVTDRSIDLPIAHQWVYAHLLEVLRSMNVDLIQPNPPSAVMAVIPYKSLGTPLRFRFHATMQTTGPSSSRIAYGIKVDWSSTFVVLGILVAIGLINIMFLSMWVGVLAPLCSIGGIGWAVYDYAVGIPNRLAAQIQKKLAAAPSPQDAYSAPAPTPAPAPVPVAPQAPSPGLSLDKAPVPTPAPTVTAPSSEDDVIAKIEKLAVLKSKGLISDAEFEQRRSELLDRL